MPKVLLYNLSGGDKLSRLKRIFLMLGIASREVRPEEFDYSIVYILGDTDDSACEVSSESDFTDEMMVLCGLNDTQLNKLLDAMKRNKCSVSLKAVLTETNAKWSSRKLFEELYAEHLSFKTSRKQIVHH